MALKAGYVGVKRWIYEKTVAGVINLKKTQEITGSVNMFIITKGSDTIQGVTYAVAEDGTVTVNNTATANSLFIANDNMVLPAGVTYRVTKGISDANPQVNVNALNGSSFVKNLVNLTTQEYVEFTPDYDGYDRMQVIIYVPNGTAISNKKISIMITPTSAIPDNYLSGAMTNRQLTKLNTLKTVNYDDTTVNANISAVAYGIYKKYGEVNQVSGKFTTSASINAWSNLFKIPGAPGMTNSLTITLYDHTDPTKSGVFKGDVYNGYVRMSLNLTAEHQYSFDMIYISDSQAIPSNRSLDREASPEVIADDPEPVTKTTRKSTKKEDN